MGTKKEKKDAKQVPRSRQAASTNVVLKENKKHPPDQLAALHKLSRRISTASSVDEVVSTALKEISAIIDPSFSFLYTRQNGQLVLKDRFPETGKAGPLLPEIKQLGECLCGRAAAMSKPVFSKNIFTDPLCTMQECKDAGVRSFAALPMIGPSGLVGVLSLASYTERDFGTEAAFLETLAGQVAIAVDHAAVSEQLKQRAGELRRHLDERMKAEALLRKANRALKAISACNEVLVRAANEQGLLESICRILVEDGGYKLAWIGYAEDDPGKRVNPAAHYGYDEGYLDTLRISWADTKQGRGPTGTAIRTGKPSVVKDIRNDPRFSVWGAEAVKRGYASSMALPLIAEGKTFGALNVYATEPDAFDAEEVLLLEQLSEDLSYGVATLRAREEHRNTMKVLNESREKYRGLFDLSPVGTVIVSPALCFTEVNGSFCGLVGYSRSELLGRSFREITHPEDKEIDAPEVKAMREGRLDWFQTEKRYVHKDGKIVWGQLTIRPIRNNEGQLLQFLAIIIDITGRKLAEERERNHEIQCNAIFNNALDAIVVSKEGVHVITNPAYRSLFGLNKDDDAAGTSIFNIVAPDERDNVLAKIRQRAQGKSIPALFYTRGLRRDGTEFDMEVHVSNYELAGERYATVILRDITERRRMEEHLRESEDRFRVIFDAAQEGIVQVSPTGLVLFANRRMAEMFGSPVDEVIGTLFFDHVHPDQRTASGALMSQLGSGEVNVVSVERHLIRRDGGDFWGLISARRLAGTDGRTRAMVGVVTDITESKNVVKALMASEEKYRTLFEESKDVIYISTPEGRLIEINPAGVALFGYSSKEELLSIDIANQLYADPEERERFMLTMDRQGSVTDFEARMKKRGGEELIIADITATAVRDDRGKIIAYRGMMRDMTDHRRIEQQLRQSQKMEAIGQLAGGIAHDFNNILSAIVGYAGIMQMKMNQDDPHLPGVEHILSSADRAANLTRSLLAFSRKQIINPRPVNVSDIIRKVERLLSRLIGEDIELLVQTAERDLTVLADSLQIEQVLMNLATNARDAMPAGGRLTLKTDAVYVDAANGMIDIEIVPKPGWYALLTASDTGIGMDAGTLEKIFEPFFTTKDVGKGTGLGLAMVYGIVKQHEGYITVSSEPGKGTTFSVFLPLIRSASQEPVTKTDRPVRTGTETILVAEDNEAVRAMTRTMLSDHGYTVIEARDGEEALRQFRAHQDSIRLLVLDVVLPKKNGRQVHEEIKKIRPGVDVLFTSGYTAEVIHTQKILDEGLHFIAKPAGIGDLLWKIREILDAKP